jgi:tRNA G37 N-methylase TrmD
MSESSKRAVSSKCRSAIMCDHAKIAAWRRAEAERITRERRPDLTER